MSSTRRRHRQGSGHRFKTTNYCEALREWDDVGGMMVKAGRGYIVSSRLPRTPKPNAIFYDPHRRYPKSVAARDLEELHAKKWIPLLKLALRKGCPRR